VLDLHADCTKCLALCCVSLTLARSADFAIDKAAGTPCPNLTDSLRCGIHASLRGDGFPGCTTYDCFGAGQRITQVTFGGVDWRTDSTRAREVFDAFGVLRQLHELLFYLRDALSRECSAPVRVRLTALQASVDAVAASDALSGVDVDTIRGEVGAALAEISAEVRSEHRGRELVRADLVGRSFAALDLRGSHFRGALLIGADFSGANLRLVDLLGADLRDADLRGADLSTALFVTQQQVNGAKGDARTTLPAALAVPAHWLVDVQP
jgi:uncharacterized protein YjbI with pentapeptide repeats